jgi:hypothetical protein
MSSQLQKYIKSKMTYYLMELISKRDMKFEVSLVMVLLATYIKELIY